LKRVAERFAFPLLSALAWIIPPALLILKAA
jgi:hypothetical protein